MNARGGFLRPRAAALIREAARRGFPDAGRLWGMTLREAALALEAFAAARRHQEEANERLAWMAGHYAAIAVHAPRRYPRRSGTAFRAAGAPAPMDEAGMKAALLALAARRDGPEGGDSHDT